ncbi:hypothetical protein NKH92_16495 [Mesorhizobium sp. M0871]|uniref:hypothetical protein n=1 Tax=Mesorhizobium sp. M0871 TaxID=2957017 RepID=UPI003337FCC2
MSLAEDEIYLIVRQNRASEIAITSNERNWIEFIRLASGDTDPPPTLDRVQRLRQIFNPDSGFLKTKLLGLAP